MQIELTTIQREMLEREAERVHVSVEQLTDRYTGMIEANFEQDIFDAANELELEAE